MQFHKRGCWLLHPEERIAEIFVGNHMPTKDIQQSSFNPTETPCANHFPYLPFPGKYLFPFSNPFSFQLSCDNIFCLAIQGLEIPLTISLPLEAQDTNICV